ncbi:MAG TPA: hypothetical protein VNN55_06260 [bacterium]|nr:hypothetical protein [bacterium]
MTRFDLSELNDPGLCPSVKTLAVAFLSHATVGHSQFQNYARLNVTRPAIQDSKEGLPIPHLGSQLKRDARSITVVTLLN